jgi:photosystem II stability/assembly factor-like uncharacterized protein
LVTNTSLSFPTSADGYYLVHVEGAMQHEAVDVYATHDGGAHWRRVERASFVGRGTPHAVGLLGDKGAMFFLNRPSGWITASDPTGIPYLYATEDGGVTWVRQTPPVPHDVPAVNGGRAINGNGILETPTFFSQTSGMLPELIELCPETSAAKDCTFAVYGYWLTDVGRRWASPQLLHQIPGQRFSPRWELLSPTHWFVSYGNLLWSTADAGHHWRLTRSIIPGGLILDELSFVTPPAGWAVAASSNPNPGGFPNRAILLRTSDTGAHWSIVRLP